MKPRTARETAVICAAAVAAVGLLTIPFDKTSASNGRALVLIAVVGMLGLAMVLGYRYLITRKRAQLELTAPSSTACLPRSTAGWPTWPSPPRSTPTSSSVR